MAAVTIPVRTPSAESGIRLMHPRRDLPAVVRLIELGFGEELDPLGWKMLEQLQRVACGSFWAHLLLGNATSPSGYVWTEKGAVVGNLSLRRAAPRWQEGWVIGNVVVHPDFRGRGIGRALMERALETAEEQDARWVGLEVRADNAVARGLYERLGFRGVGQTWHLIHPAKTPWTTLPVPAPVWRVSKPEDAALWSHLAGRIYGRRQREVVEVRPSLYTFGGWERKFDRWLRGQREWAWLENAESPRYAVHVQTDKGHRFHNWELLLHPEEGGRAARETVARAFSTLGHRRAWEVVTIVEERSALIPLLQELGFQLHRVLLQMILDLR
ncbi:MAG: GNAT family N-acetyltransferase [Anaerolineales bacterium]